jgi:hypothetical protein
MCTYIPKTFDFNSQPSKANTQALVIQVIRLIDFAFAFAGTKRILFKKVFKINIEVIGEQQYCRK